MSVACYRWFHSFQNGYGVTSQMTVDWIQLHVLVNHSRIQKIHPKYRKHCFRPYVGQPDDHWCHLHQFILLTQRPILKILEKILKISVSSINLEYKSILLLWKFLSKRVINSLKLYLLFISQTSTNESGLSVWCPVKVLKINLLELCLGLVSYTIIRQVNRIW